MIAYDYEVLQSKDLFTEEIRDTVDKLPLALTFSPELNDFIMQFLILNPKDRPKCCAICRHPWLAGAFDVLLVSRGSGHQVQYNSGGDCYRGGGGVGSRPGMVGGSYSSNNSGRIGNFGSTLTHGLSNELHRTQPGTPTRLHSPQSNSSKSLNLRPVGSFAEAPYTSKCTLPSLNIMSPRESIFPMSPIFIEGDLTLNDKSPCASPSAIQITHAEILTNPKGFSGLDSKEKVLLENYIRSRSGSFIGSQVPTRRNTIGDIIPVVDMSPWQRSQVGGGSGKISMSVSQSQDNFNGTEPICRSPESRSSVQLPPISVDFNGSSSFTTNSNEKYSQLDDTANEFSTVNSSSFNTVTGASPSTDIALHSSLLALQLENALEDYDWGNLQHFNGELRANDRDGQNRVMSDKHASRPKKENSSGSSASSAGVSFYGYGNRNYSAPRGSFVTESTGPRGSFAFDQFSNLRSSMTDDGNPVRHSSFATDTGSHPRGSFAIDVSEKLYKKASSVNTSNKGGRINNESQPLGSKSKN